MINDKINWLSLAINKTLIGNDSPMIVIQGTTRQIDFIISSLLASCERKFVSKSSVILKGTQLCGNEVIPLNLEFE